MKLILPSPVTSAAVRSEQARLDALDAYDVLDSDPEPAFDRLTSLARLVFGVSMSTITFVDGHRQWFKSRQGLAACETDREPALCYAAVQLPGALILPDASADARFADNPFVRGEPHIRFYAGTQLRSPDGVAIGTFCAMDPRPRNFGAADGEILAELGGLTTDLLELRRKAAPPRRPEAGTRHVLKAGRLIFDKAQAGIACTIRSLSAGGAGVDVLSTAGVPDRVALMIDSDGVSRLCTVAAKAERHLELAFES
jgi:hypothetical protein